MSVVLHDFWRSSACYRVRIALSLKAIAYARVVVDLTTGAQRDPSYRAINPQAFVPMLEIDGLRLTQSLAICDYLDAKVEVNPFVPADPAARSRVLAMAMIIAADVHPLNNLRVLNYLTGTLGASSDARDTWVRTWIAHGFAALEALAVEASANKTPYLSGETPGLADICLVPQMYNARRFETDLSAFPTLVEIDTRLTSLPSFAAAHPDAVRP